LHQHVRGTQCFTTPSPLRCARPIYGGVFDPRRFDASQPLTSLSPSRLHLGVGFLANVFFQDGVAEPSLRRPISVKRTSLEQTRTSSIARCLFSTWSLSTPRRARGCQQELSPRTSHRDRAFTSFDALALHDSARFRLSLVSTLFLRRPCGAIRKNR